MNPLTITLPAYTFILVSAESIPALKRLPLMIK